MVVVTSKIASDHSEIYQKCDQLIPNGICDTFQPVIDILYGLDDEIWPKLNLRASAPSTIQYRSLAARP